VTIPSQLRQKHDLVKPYIDQVAIRVKDVVSALCDDAGFAYLGRVKELNSLSEKIETGRFGTWSDLDDLFACAVIIPTLSDEPRVLSYLREKFFQLECKVRGETMKDPAVFRFDATRFIGRLNPALFPDAGAEILNILFEVQIRTAFEHAWSVTTHALAYKGTRVDWRHMRLAAQMRAATEQLDQVVAGFENNATFIAEQVWPEVAAQQSIQQFFAAHFEAGRLPTEATPLSWGRFCENLLKLLLSNTKRRPRDIKSHTACGLNHINKEIYATGADAFPRSLSLMQFCVGALAKARFVDGPLRQFVPLITPELTSLYPDVAAMGAGFDFDLSTAAAPFPNQGNRK
jgi:ppGpp synthetase/RelA/SpoT-type nucleotidyltranferase